MVCLFAILSKVSSDEVDTIPLSQLKEARPALLSHLMKYPQGASLTINFIDVGPETPS